MESYQLTNAWMNTLGKQCHDNQEAINRLRESFISFRKNVSTLANEIGRSLPDYTIHDITHIDALWEMTDCICGADYELNPVEGFILGGAFLLHDLAMSLAAYPQGVEYLESLPIWSDTLVQRCNKLGVSIPGSSKYKDLPEATREYVISTVLRKLHASSAEKLAINAWKSSQGDMFLIDNPEIRQSFGRIIGKIAHSHWWNISRLENEFERLIGAPSWCPRNWTIDPLKLACILRVADASHIDSRRAPQFLRTLRKLTPTSDEHWCFQEKLQKPYLSEDSLFYTSGYSFNSSEASSWWLCYEALKMIDKELRQTDALLADRAMNRFKAKRVFGIESPERLSSLIQSEEWSPIDAFIHIGDLPKIIRNLGGEELYGKDLTVPIRELIQNSSDAIRARRKLENRDDSWGKIKVSIFHEDDEKYIEVEDDGIGMSLDVIKNYLFDFGNSYWGSELMLEEHPGLMAKDIKVTGKYGIGFFSSFMFGNDIKITTRKCTKAQEDTHVIEFRSGLNARPVIRNAKPNEYLIDGGTRVRIKIEDQDAFNKIFKISNRKTRSLGELCISIAPALDVDIITTDGENKSHIPKDNWINCSDFEFLKLLYTINNHEEFNDYTDEDIKNFIEKASNNVRPIHSETGLLIGRAFLGLTMMDSSKKSPSLRGCVVVGGLVESQMSGISGIVIGRNTNAARDNSIISASEDIMSKWVSEQAELVPHLYKKESLASISQIVRILKGHPGLLPIAIFENQYINCVELEEILRSKTEIIITSDFFYKYRAKDFDAISYEPNVIFASTSRVPSIFHKKRNEHWSGFGAKNWIFELTCTGFIVEIIAKTWSVELSKCLDIISDMETNKVATIAKNNEKKITETAYIFRKETLKGT
ncbi:ATP-binding protein [Aeromonas salmonicida]|uniref:HD domain-containing protein n=1 Tax=Aeromonas salmonicida TaxID=645 RepID=UPI00145C0B94|nr:ATP-binding protein [Aeromonas salmonicida]